MQKKDNEMIKKINERMKKRGVTRSALALAIGAANSHVSDWLNEKQPIPRHPLAEGSGFLWGGDGDAAGVLPQ